jgi:hypothetical protein
MTGMSIARDISMVVAGAGGSLIGQYIQRRSHIRPWTFAMIVVGLAVLAIAAFYWVSRFAG